jgi:hypothetical protein
MANALGKPVQVHQALHGYADGHRMLAGSMQLKSHDQKTMLIMSDVSGAGASLETQGYLTGYPLQDSGVYALARTWAATEMARPGCVWTHTLLVDFTDLAVLPSMSFLDVVFQRPTQGLHQQNYGSPVTIEDPWIEDSANAIDLDLLKRVLAGLYGYPKEKVLSNTAKDPSQIVFAVWAQQWPRLRRGFRFCTSSFSDRSTDGTPFDLQFTPIQDRSVRLRFADVLEVNRISLPPFIWLEDAVDDILSGNGELRRFLRDVGGDVDGGREMFVPLSSLHTMIPYFAGDSESVDKALSLIDTAFETTSATSLRTLLVSAIARHPENINDRSAEFLVKHFDLLARPDLLDKAYDLGKVLWTFKPERLLNSTPAEGSFSGFARSTIKNLDAPMLVKAANKNHSLLPLLLAKRPDLLEEPEVWSVRGEWTHDVLRNSTENAGTVLRNILLAGRSDLAQEVVDSFGASRVLRSLSDLFQAENREAVQSNLTTWFDVLVRNSVAVADFLNCQSPVKASVLLLIATRSHPDSIPNEVGADPWVTAISNISGQLENAQRLYLASYLLARALGYESHSQADLIEFSFDDVYFGALNQRLAEDAWKLVDKSLPRSWWPDWDRCRRMRDTVVDVFINRDLPAAGFTRITQDNPLFIELSRLAASNSRGRKYLKTVLHFLRDSGGPDARIRIIEEAI